MFEIFTGAYFLKLPPPYGDGDLLDVLDQVVRVGGGLTDLQKQHFERYQSEPWTKEKQVRMSRADGNPFVED